MTRFFDRQQALQLRKAGLSYSQIKKILKVSKSTLSYWLREYPLSKERIRELRDKNELRIEKFRETMRKKRERRLQVYYKEQKKIVLQLEGRDYYLGGLFLYWGEGTKSYVNGLSLSNTDPAMLRFFIKWLWFCFKVPKIKLAVQLQLYSDMDMWQEIKFWSNVLNLSRKQFTRPYIKRTLLNQVSHKGGFGHGTCNIRVRDVRLSEKVLMGLKVITDKYNKERL